VILILFHWEINVNNVSCVSLWNFCSMFSKWRGPHLKRQSSAKLYCIVANILNATRALK